MNGDNQLRFYLKKEAIVDVYLPHLESYDKRINVFYGGAGSGKSYFVTQKLIFKFLKDPGRKGLVIRKVQNTLRDSIFAEFIKMLSAWQLLDKCRVNKSHLEIELPNGSTFLFKGMDDPEKIKSISDISDIVIEEATELNEADFSQLRKRLRSSKPFNQIHLMFNPVSKSNWVYKTWFAEDSVVPENTMILHTTYKDNNFLKQAYIDDLESDKLTNYELYEIYALGKFASLDKLVYTNVSIEDFDYREILKSDKDIEAYFGLDFGYTADPTAFVATLLDKKNKKIYIFDEFYERGLLNNEIANEIIKRGYRKEKILADSAEPKSIAELKRLGLDRVVGAKKGQGSILNGIQYIQQHEVIVHSSCVNAIEEFKNYSWMKDKKGVYINKPTDDYNHLLDALRYALSITHNIGKVKLLDRRKLGI